MNVILNPLQGDTKAGAITLTANADLTGKANYLVKIVNNAGTPQFALPSGTDDFAVFVLASDGVAGAEVAAESPTQGENFRAILKGACSPGDEISLADPATAADAGKVRKRPTTTGTWRTFAIAEEAGVDGQNVLLRRVSERTTTI